VSRQTQLHTVPTEAEADALIQVLIVQDHALLASALARILEGEPDLAVAAVCVTGTDAAIAAAQTRPNVVLIDFRLPDVTGPAAARLIKNEHPEAAIVFHSADQTEAALQEAIDAGATAYLTMDATVEQIISAIRRASTGEVLIPAKVFARAIAKRRGAGLQGVVSAARNASSSVSASRQLRVTR